MIEGAYSAALVEVQGQSRKLCAAPAVVVVNALPLASARPSMRAVAPALHARHPPNVAERKLYLG
jgi:hypothetical protein